MSPSLVVSEPVLEPSMTFFSGDAVTCLVSGPPTACVVLQERLSEMCPLHGDQALTVRVRRERHAPKLAR